MGVWQILKALDYSKLVPEKVPVHGQHGIYFGIRYKRPETEDAPTPQVFAPRSKTDLQRDANAAMLHMLQNWIPRTLWQVLHQGGLREVVLTFEQMHDIEDLRELPELQEEALDWGRFNDSYFVASKGRLYIHVPEREPFWKLFRIALGGLGRAAYHLFGYEHNQDIQNILQTVRIGKETPEEAFGRWFANGYMAAVGLVSSIGRLPTPAMRAFQQELEAFLPANLRERVLQEAFGYPVHAPDIPVPITTVTEEEQEKEFVQDILETLRHPKLKPLIEALGRMEGRIVLSRNYFGLVWNPLVRTAATPAPGQSTVPLGVFHPHLRYIYASGSSADLIKHVLLHELGHFLLSYLTSADAPDLTGELAVLHTHYYDQIRWDYLQGSGPGSHDGLGEFFAENFAQYMFSPEGRLFVHTQYPALGRLIDNILAYLSGQTPFVHSARSLLVPAAEVDRGIWVVDEWHPSKTREQKRLLRVEAGTPEDITDDAVAAAAQALKKIPLPVLADLGEHAFLYISNASRLPEYLRDTFPEVEQKRKEIYLSPHKEGALVMLQHGATDYTVLYAVGLLAAELLSHDQILDGFVEAHAQLEPSLIPEERGSQGRKYFYARCFADYFYSKATRRSLKQQYPQIHTLFDQSFGRMETLEQQEKKQRKKSKGEGFLVML